MGIGAERTIALGTLGFGSATDEATSFAILDRFAELGGSVLDTADNYAHWVDGCDGGESERTIGAWLRATGARSRMTLSTKVGGRPVSPGSAKPEGLSAQAIEAGLAGSLGRLGADRVDVYWAHTEDRSTPLAETVAAFASLVDAGLVGELGASNHAVWRLERARALAAGGGRAAFRHLQYRYSYLQPRLDVPLPSSAHVHVTPELLDFARTEHLALWVYSPLLSGAYTRPDVALPAAYDHPGTPKRLAALRGVAAEIGATPNQAVLAYLMGGPTPMIPIVGVSKVSQVEEAMGALAVELSPEQRRRMDSAGVR